MRSLLFVPGNKDDMLVKAAGLAADRPDLLVPDLEDSVPDGEKPRARSTVADWLARVATPPRDGLPAAGRRPPPKLLPRINALASEWFDDDVRAVAVPGVFGLSIGKIESAADIVAIDAALLSAERSAGLARRCLKLIPWIESARAVVDAFAIAAASERIVAVAFGGEDYANDLGVERPDDESNVRYARAAICNAARAAGVLALDTPYFQFRDAAGLETSSLAARRLGFKGRFAIHPAQIATINACFAPSPAEIDEARRIVAAFEAAERTGRGSTSLDGRVIDIPVVKRARALLAAADDQA